jgi:methionine-gamma-lyase
VLVCDDVYGGTGRLFRRLYAKYDIDFQFIEMSNLALVEQAVTSKTKMLWVETPTNPTMKIIDIAGIANIAKRHHALLVVDNTFASPIFQNPLSLGADVVVHSTTKYIGGHSDLIAGAVLGGSKYMKRVRTLRTFLGNMAGPWTGWLLMRSLETLKVRMNKQAENAVQVANFLQSHPKVEKVYYLGFIPEGTRQYEIYQKQLSCAGAMLSFDIEGGEAEAFKFLNSLKLMTLAVSLGSTESLAEHPATMTHSDVSPKDREEIHISEKLVRLSIGVEHFDDIIWDISQALDQV